MRVRESKGIQKKKRRNRRNKKKNNSKPDPFKMSTVNTTLDKIEKQPLTRKDNKWENSRERLQKESQRLSDSIMRTE
eukprot:g3016.t1